MLKIAWSPLYSHPLPEGHRFPMEKYALLPEQLKYEGTANDSHFFEPGMLDEKWILDVHDHDYLQKLHSLSLSRKEERKTGFPLSKQLVQREINILCGSVMACEFALEHGIAMNIAGGTHHAYADHGEGFCLLNDIAVAANYLLKNKLAKRVLVVDLDVHQGNGTALLCKDEPNIFTFSMHGKSNYPMHKEKSDFDIALPDHTKDGIYLENLKITLPKLIDKFQPDFIIYQCGVDILDSDKLGKLSVSLQGIRERDEFVLGSAFEKDIPVMCCMGGGYSPQIRDIIEAHAMVYRLAQDIFF
ncbi:histone deacetylase family protein [Algoriphagus sediminis]|uniref:Histone deacetylase n=1 Tax=Algoriphagus sediminis TaxID=3057113 RepID=A0ABT7YB13_9BACT|nr:histone deacetylase [Algoriphagus sediminis]MDN3203701.1 histone deacetylase [Algoriphagus sediminis]